MQRLFSNFANGWPGTGILMQRGLAGSILLYCGFLQLSTRPSAAALIPEAASALSGLLLMLGLWTPVAGTTAIVAQLWILSLGERLPVSAEMAGILGLTIAMVGPGAWSIDALIFGRKHISSRLPQK